MEFKSFDELVEKIKKVNLDDYNASVTEPQKDLELGLNNFFVKFFNNYQVKLQINDIHFTKEDLISIMNNFIEDLYDLKKYHKYININFKTVNELEEINERYDDLFCFCLRRVEILMYILGLEITDHVKTLIETTSGLLYEVNVGKKLDDDSWDYDSCVKNFIFNIANIFDLI